ncbi:hypothetical protein FNW52_02670 [Flavobacterium sp. ZT3R18]|uniref:hypothetical protein n=1 Tax=Flavobacterium sp. ZT3R18 TaxID=2594429 RepID=UPI00117B6CA3|nr:hypothetical protein [Flavobacterium sp. ZT3R18]TRX37819.1 hypothetical protein FNW52_02670 [Flavobacterium sp. ZT3R18]
MTKLLEEIKNLEELNNYCLNFENFKNQEDIRSITNHYICQTIQNFIISIKLSFNLKEIDYCKKNISEQLNDDDLKVLQNNFIAYSKEAFFINFSIIVENHFRQIAIHYENDTNKINVTPIKKTFENIFIENKFNNSLSEDEINTYYFFLYLRNTMHNIGIHTKDDIKINFNDSNSIFTFDKISLSLTENNFNNITFFELVFLIEQVCKLVNKTNLKIESNEFIKHRLVDAGFNE